MMNVSRIEFLAIDGVRADCMLRSETGQVTLQCTSLLPRNSLPHQHRIAWLQDALRQIKRMPDFHNNSRMLEEAVTNSLRQLCSP